MHQLLVELKPVCAAEPVYQVLERVFGEHFQLEQEGVVTKPNQDLSATSLQSPHDLEATYREKRGCTPSREAHHTHIFNYSSR